MQVVGEEKPVAATVDEAKQEEPAKDQEKKENVFDDVEKATEPDGKVDKTVESSSRLPGSNPDPNSRIKLNESDYTAEDLVITPEEKQAFIEAMLSGDRYRQSISIYGGKVKVILRSRTTDETNAMYAYIRHILSRSDEESGLAIAEGDMAYVPLVAQIEEINGTKFPEMKAPYSYQESAGKETEPGWMPDYKAWRAKPDCLTSVLINRIQLFEYKYWTMVKEANNKNFWKSDTSIVG